MIEISEFLTTILGDKNIVGPDPILIKGLTEKITKTDGLITEHFFLYEGVRYDYSAIDSLITVVTRNDEFTSEFSQEISDFPASGLPANGTYSDAVKLLGVPDSSRVKNVEMSSFIALFSEIPNRSSTIVCIGVQWNHSDLSGCAPRVGCWLGGY